MTMPSVLMIAFHFPPLAGSSGIQRTLRHVQHLPALGWQPLVLTAHPRAYERVSADLDAEVPAGTVVERAFALDTARHLSIKGRYIAALARPDRWLSWRLDAVRRGRALIARHRPAVIWSTYPIATAHLIGAALQRSSGLPWIADFRDPMAQEGYPADPLTWAQFDRIERQAIASARFSTFTTPGAARVYRQRYPAHAARILVQENGYDEPSFVAAETEIAARPAERLHETGLTLLHSGIVYPEERDPTALMHALALLHARGCITPGQFRIRFRAAVAEGLLRTLAAEHGVQAYVELCPPIPYAQALAEMLRTDALLLMQAANCNEQIPAKAYEYLRAGRPVVGLAHPDGDTWSLLQQAAGTQLLARLDDAADIAATLERFIAAPAAQALPSRQAVHAASRQHRAVEFVQMLEQASGVRGAGVPHVDPARA